MTIEEILNTPEIVDFMIDESATIDSKMKLHKRLEELCKLAIKALEQKDVLDKIGAEIEKHRRKTQSIDPYDLVGDCLDIIDKYKAESEEEK